MRTHVIVPMHNEASSFLDESPYVKYLVSDLEKALDKHVISRVTFVDDGSDDSSASYVKELTGKNRKIEVLELERVGKAKAIRDGLTRATKSERVLFMDADMYNVSPLFYGKMTAALTDVKMSVGVISQGGKIHLPEFSGIRAFDTYSLLPLLDDSNPINGFFDYDDPGKGFGLERFLTHLFISSYRNIPFHEIESRPAGTGSKGNLLKGFAWAVDFLVDYHCRYGPEIKSFYNQL